MSKVERWLAQAWVYWSLVVILVVATGMLLVKIGILSAISGQTPFLDFDVYHQMVRDVVRGSHPYQLPYMQTMGPPAVILAYLSFLWLPLAAARGVMTAVSLLSILGTAWLLAAKTQPRRRALTTAILSFLILLTFPARFTLLMGQSNLLLMLLATVVLTVNSSRLAGIALAIITLFKTNYLLWWVSFLRRPRLLVWSGVVFIVILLCALPLVKVSHYQDFIRQKSVTLLEASPNQGTDYYNQSLRSSAARLLIPQWYPLIFILLVIWWLFLVKTRNDAGIGLVFSLLLSPIVWQHYLIVLFPVCLLALCRSVRSRLLVGLLLVSACCLFTQFTQLHVEKTAVITGLAASHMYIGMLLLVLALQLGSRGRLQVQK